MVQAFQLPHASSQSRRERNNELGRSRRSFAALLSILAVLTKIFTNFLASVKISRNL
jgi:hypothetical protein